MKVKDREFEEFISTTEMKKVVERLVSSVKRDYKGRNPLFLVMLNGAFVFAADFLRAWGDPVETEFVKYTSYEGMSSTGVIRPVMEVQSDVEGRDVVVLEDVVDTGATMESFLEEVRKRNPKSVAVVSLFSKPDVLHGKVKLDYVGRELPNRFIVGFGLDYDGFGRNLPALYVLKKN